MADNVNFERLVSGLTLEERQNLLDKLKGLSSMTLEPLYAEDDEKVLAINIEAEYPHLPWYSRLWYFIQSFLKSRDPVKIFGDHQISVLGNKIEEKSPALYDHNKNLLMPAFYRQIVRLKEAARFFYSALDVSVGRDKGTFFSFLGSLEMPDVHRKLQEETDPKVILEKNPDTGELELRQMAFKIMDDALALVTGDYRDVMYFDARILYCLKELSSFLFDRVIMSFSPAGAVNGETCPAGLVREHLVSLNNILHSLLVVPPLPLLESLFVFTLQDREREPGLDLNREMRILLAKAEESTDVIREFNKNVPLTWIIRCSTRDMTFSPKPIGGGEDWFVVYRDYWKRRIESLFSEYMKGRRYRELLTEFRYFLKGTSLKTLENIQSESNPDGVPVKGAFGLSFLATFYTVVFIPETNRILRPILIDGDFHKKENRIEFAESYNNLITLEDDIKKFEHDISPSGDYGQRYARAMQEMSSLPVKRRKIQIAVDEASKKANSIFTGGKEASRSIVNILYGILGRSSSNQYDSLSNFAKMAGKDNLFINDLEETIQQLLKLIKLLDDIDAMENQR